MDIRTQGPSAAAHGRGGADRPPGRLRGLGRARTRTAASLAALALATVLVPAAHGHGRGPTADLVPGAPSVAAARLAAQGATRKTPPKKAPVVTGTAITALPFSGGGDYLGAGSGGDGTAVANALVAGACNGGEPVHAPQWYTLQAAPLGQVVVRADALAYPRGVDDMPHGTAVVDQRTGRVLACGEGPVTLAADRPVGVVAFFASGDDDCESTEEYSWCRGVQLRVFLDLAGDAPENDTWTAASHIDTLPFTASVDLSLAGADDVRLRHYEECLQSSFVPVNTATAWWRVTYTGATRPALTVDPTRSWVSPSQWRVPYGEILAETADGPVLLPLSDPWDCVDGAPVAGQPHYVAAFVEYDSYQERLLAPGGPVHVRLGDVAEPRVPRALGASDVRGRSARIAWQAPAEGGDAPVSRYQISWREMGDASAPTRAVMVPASDLSRSIVGLEPGRAYAVGVRAVSAAGASVAATATVLTPRAGDR